MGCLLVGFIGLSTVHRLPYDYSRCGGTASKPLGDGQELVVECDQRDNCRRFLDRDHTGPRTPTLFDIVLNDDGECDYQLKANDED